MKFNKEYRISLRDGNWVTYHDRKFLKNQIKKEQVSGFVAGVAFCLIFIIVVVFIGLEVFK